MVPGPKGDPMELNKYLKLSPEVAEALAEYAAVLKSDESEK